MKGKQICSAVILLMVCVLSAWAVLNGDIEGFVADSSGAFGGRQGCGSVTSQEGGSP